MRHPRHEQAIKVFERASSAIPGDQKYVVIIYDGPSIPAWDRKASYISDAPVGDVKLICKAMAEQIDA